MTIKDFIALWHYVPAVSTNDTTSYMPVCYKGVVVIINNLVRSKGAPSYLNVEIRITREQFRLKLFTLAVYNEN